MRPSAPKICFTLCLCVMWAACGSDKAPRAPQLVALCQQFKIHWDLMPHRLGLLQLTSHMDSNTAQVSAQNDGGSFGDVDTPKFDYGLYAVRSSDLAVVYGSIQIPIGPGAELDGQAFSAQGELALDAGELKGSRRQVAFFHGLAIHTDLYQEEPAFESDPLLPYDPAHGYTTGGLGVELGPVELSGGQALVPVRVRNTLTVADRADMNAAIPQATTWVTVDVAVVGAFSESPLEVQTGQTAYYISGDEYGVDTVHEHAPLAEQAISFAQRPDSGQALFGLTAFDFWLNQEGLHDPACEVIQDEFNFDGQPVSGPGRYVRELSWSLAVDEQVPQALLDLFFTNSSIFKEVGNVCLKASGSVAMLPYDDPQAQVLPAQTTSFSLSSGETGGQRIRF